MPQETSPSALTGFIARWIHSVEQLEILCLLSAEPERRWSVPEVLARVQSSENSIVRSLQQFVQEGLVRAEANGSYRFAPRERKWVPIMAELRAAYQKRPVSIIQAIYASRPVVGSAVLPSAATDLPSSLPAQPSEPSC